MVPLRRLFSDIQTFQAAKDVSTSQDNLVELFNRIGYFFRRLEIYTGVPPTTAMTDIIVEIMVKIITILGIATKEIQRGRLSELIPRRFTFFTDTYSEKYLRKLMGNVEIEDALQELDKLTLEEARIASAELLKITHGVDDRVKGVDERVQEVHDEVRDIDDKLEEANRTSSLNLTVLRSDHSDTLRKPP